MSENNHKDQNKTEISDDSNKNNTKSDPSDQLDQPDQAQVPLINLNILTPSNENIKIQVCF